MLFDKSGRSERKTVEITKAVVGAMNFHHIDHFEIDRIYVTSSEWVSMTYAVVFYAST